MKKFVVTGAGGYIGSVLVTSLLESGHEVLAVDRFFFGIKPIEQHLNNPKFKILKKDIRDLEKRIENPIQRAKAFPYVIQLFTREDYKEYYKLAL
jgi:nucleoside-diphosphate-sugar epimerase